MTESKWQEHTVMKKLNKGTQWACKEVQWARVRNSICTVGSCLYIDLMHQHFATDNMAPTVVSELQLGSGYEAGMDSLDSADADGVSDYLPTGAAGTSLEPERDSGGAPLLKLSRQSVALTSRLRSGLSGRLRGADLPLFLICASFLSHRLTDKYANAEQCGRRGACQSPTHCR